jgi:hypothetical protein
MVYQWKHGAHGAGLDAQRVGDRLEKIRRKNGGELKPDSIVDDARPANAMLHPVFEWDDGKAADKYRLDQARCLIRSVVVTFDDVPDAPQGVRAFVHVQSPGAEGKSYTHIGVAIADPDMRKQLLGQAVAELTGWQRRWKDYNEMGVVFDAIKQMKAELLLPAK